MRWYDDGDFWAAVRVRTLSCHPTRLLGQRARAQFRLPITLRTFKRVALDLRVGGQREAPRDVASAGPVDGLDVR